MRHAPQQITDRAKRYRAQRAIEQADQRCIYCGAPASSGRRLVVEHINGREADNAPENLGRACYPCNVTKGVHFARAGKGIKTQQYNPRKKAAGARSLGAYVKAILTTKGYDTGMDLSSAVELLRATSPADRSRYASDIWARRKERAGEVPF